MGTLQVWQEPHGDRRQEVTFMGIEMDIQALTTSLDACTLTEEEMSAGAEAWRQYHDPFPDFGAPRA